MQVNRFQAAQSASVHFQIARIRHMLKHDTAVRGHVLAYGQPMVLYRIKGYLLLERKAQQDGRSRTPPELLDNILMALNKLLEGVNQDALSRVDRDYARTAFEHHLRTKALLTHKMWDVPEGFEAIDVNVLLTYVHTHLGDQLWRYGMLKVLWTIRGYFIHLFQMIGDEYCQMDYGQEHSADRLAGRWVEICGNLLDHYAQGESVQLWQEREFAPTVWDAVYASAKDHFPPARDLVERIFGRQHQPTDRGGW